MLAFLLTSPKREFLAPEKAASINGSGWCGGSSLVSYRQACDYDKDEGRWVCYGFNYCTTGWCDLEIVQVPCGANCGTANDFTDDCGWF
ncbi:hypothetical protein Mal65_05520 [Crateriforma conspicua]|nr:hypothetical protein Mal65_05520 [Crateriforma conspicua]